MAFASWQQAWAGRRWQRSSCASRSTGAGLQTCFPAIQCRPVEFVPLLLSLESMAFAEVLSWLLLISCVCVSCCCLTYTSQPGAPCRHPAERGAVLVLGCSEWQRDVLRQELQRMDSWGNLDQAAAQQLAAASQPAQQPPGDVPQVCRLLATRLELACCMSCRTWTAPITGHAPCLCSYCRQAISVIMLPDCLMRVLWSCLDPGTAQQLAAASEPEWQPPKIEAQGCSVAAS